jgi:uncharacterized GH25 family protein
MRPRPLVLLSLLLATAPLSAHDFWIEPSTFRPAAGQNVGVALRVGENFLGDPVPRSAQLLDSFTVRDAAGERDVFGLERQDPAGILRIDKPGLAMIGYRSKGYPLELPAAKFEEFLKAEGLERVSALRASRGESQKPDREKFYRYAKSILASGSKAAGFDRPLGYRFELVPETDPMASAPLRVRVLLDGKPRAGALVKAIHRDDPAARLAARTDAAGRVTLKLPKPGVWLLTTVEMTPAPAGSGFDWEGLWASLTFER